MLIATLGRIRNLGILAGVLLVAAPSLAQKLDRSHPGETRADLARKADLVVVGKVLNVDSRWEGRKIVSTARVQPLELVKGSLPAAAQKVLEVRFLGGQVGPWAQEFSHEITLTEGETAALFLAPLPSADRSKTPVFRLLGEEAKVSLLRPKDPASRLKSNRRLAGRVEALRAAVKAGT